MGIGRDVHLASVHNARDRTGTPSSMTFRGYSHSQGICSRDAREVWQTCFINHIIYSSP